MSGMEEDNILPEIDISIIEEAKKAYGLSEQNVNSILRVSAVLCVDPAYLIVSKSIRASLPCSIRLSSFTKSSAVFQHGKLRMYVALRYLLLLAKTRASYT
jgi:hypothetical protein